MDKDPLAHTHARTHIQEALSAAEEQRLAEERNRDQKAYRDRKAELLTRLGGVAAAPPTTFEAAAPEETETEPDVTLSIAGKSVTCKLSSIGDEQLGVMTDQEFDAYAISLFPHTHSARTASHSTQHRNTITQHRESTTQHRTAPHSIARSLGSITQRTPCRYNALVSLNGGEDNMDDDDDF
jgi:hypothetical protein